ncbi:hypothetical protein WJX81_001279 [Elliptochloris bilobata]|uniref:SUI1 domain-containing protein n=1 Tax=Elliptochloris bilobata TaxID=381761 RepID=A0AAW1QCA9_9CHLO
MTRWLALIVACCPVCLAGASAQALTLTGTAYGAGYLTGCTVKPYQAFIGGQDFTSSSFYNIFGPILGVPDASRGATEDLIAEALVHTIGFSPGGAAADAFADAAAEEKDTSAGNAGSYVHIRIQQRNGKKSLTTIQGLEKGFDYKKVLKAFKKEFCCNGTVVEDSELGHVIQLQGDQRKNVSTFLTTNNIAKKDLIKVHGF